MAAEHTTRSLHAQLLSALPGALLGRTLCCWTITLLLHCNRLAVPDPTGAVAPRTGGMAARCAGDCRTFAGISSILTGRMSPIMCIVQGHSALGTSTCSSNTLTEQQPLHI